MISIPPDSEIESIGVGETLVLAESLFISTGGLDIAAVKRLVLAASRCLDVEPEDPAMVADQIQVTLEEAEDLYNNLALTEEIDPVDEESEDPMDFILAIVNWYDANLPA